MLDSELELYIHKPVAFAGVSSGMWGGVRAIEALVTSVREMGLVSTFHSVHFPKVKELFTEDGNMQPEQVERYTKTVQKAYKELIWMAEALKWGRENLPKA